METIIKLNATIDTSKDPAEVRVEANSEGPKAMWDDLGYWLETTGFMAYQAMKYREWSEEQMVDYVSEYIGKCLKDYKLK